MMNRVQQESGHSIPKWLTDDRGSDPISIPSRKERERNDAWMDKHMAKIARIHEENDGTGPDWIFHQIIRFMHDGYPHHAGGLFQRLLAEEGETLRVRGLRMVLESEAKKPTPFGWLGPIKVGSAAARARLLSKIRKGRRH